MEKLLSIYFEGDEHNRTLCAKFRAQDGTIHDTCGITKCCEALKTLPPHKVWKTKERFEEVLSDQYRAGGYHRHSDYSDDLREISAAAVEVSKKFPYLFKEYHNHNTGHSFVKCYTWNTEEEDYTSEWWDGSRSCANGLIWIYQNDPDNYIYSVEALREAIENIYEEPYLSAALSDVDKAEEKVEKIKKSKPSRVDFSSVPVEDDYINTNLYGDECKIPTSGFYGDYYYDEFSEGYHVVFQSGQMKTTDYKDFEPFFRRFYEVTNNKDYIISRLRDALSDFDNGYIKANSVNLCEKREIEKEFSETVEINGKKISVRRKPVKVSVPRYIEIPKEVVEGNPEVSFASGSLFYILSSLLRLSSYTKTKELKEMVIDEVGGFVRFKVDEGWMHKFLINRGAWILHNSNFADEEKIIHPRSSEVCCTLDDNKGWMDGDKLRFWWRAFSPAYVNKPVTLSFPSREIMRITE